MNSWSSIFLRYARVNLLSLVYQTSTSMRIWQLDYIYVKTEYKYGILLDFLVTVKAAPHECVIRTGQP